MVCIFCLAIVPSACIDPGRILNGRAIPNSSDTPFPIWTVVTFECLVGYKLVGLSRRQCRTDGTWSGIENPRCERKKQNNYSTLLFLIKDDFQSVVLHTVEFCFITKCKHKREVNLNFHLDRHYGCETLSFLL